MHRGGKQDQFLELQIPYSVAGAKGGREAIRDGAEETASGPDSPEFCAAGC